MCKGRSWKDSSLFSLSDTSCLLTLTGQSKSPGHAERPGTGEVHSYRVLMEDKKKEKGKVEEKKEMRKGKKKERQKEEMQG